MYQKSKVIITNLIFLQKKKKKTCLNCTSHSGLELLGTANWHITIEEMACAEPAYRPFASDPKVAERLKIEALYTDHVAAQSEEIEAVRRDLSLVIPLDMDYYWYACECVFCMEALDI